MRITESELEMLLSPRKKELKAYASKNPTLNTDITKDYWGNLVIKGFRAPEDLSIPEVFELGRYCERMFRDGDVDQSMLALRYTRMVQGDIQKSVKLSHAK